MNLEEHVFGRIAIILGKRATLDEPTETARVISVETNANGDIPACVFLDGYPDTMFPCRESGWTPDVGEVVIVHLPIDDIHYITEVQGQ